ncbi:Signal transduction histidine kinase [Paenibacillus uliginis N3/975]|uniref:histidine kinase n=1 Tax=Paenibacillus uliginis N3/975 TaxID=1313296 RepID=A0A1X7HCE9_9BACL|nr:sensor histidine kinase [Paenibacillus uliginis]SMF83947.1 Signal transduction histidine kinase [Paenibacillus uliginis N3/975]
MTFLRYLTYEKPYIYLYLAVFLISAAVFFTDSNGAWAWGTFFYAFALSSMVLLGFLLFRYQQNVRVIRQMKSEDYDSLSLEGEFAKAHVDELKKQHIREMNRNRDRQNEHYDFIVSWFHEIKTPIAVLRLLQQTDMDADSLREEITKIENYVDQALYYAKLDSFNQDYDIQNCDMIRISKEIVKAHSKTFFSKKIRMDIQAETLAVQSDPKWLQFIVNQLLTNSLKYTEHGGEITISAFETPQEKQLLIRDNGIGISQKDLPRIFNRGFTGETGRTYTKSTGMGLYLAQQLSNKLGHYITCTSEASVYTQFIIHFPKDDDPYLLLQQKTQ